VVAIRLLPMMLPRPRAYRRTIVLLSARIFLAAIQTDHLRALDGEISGRLLANRQSDQCMNGIPIFGLPQSIKPGNYLPCSPEIATPRRHRRQRPVVSMAFGMLRS
jgi:hypothetical protein